jgi:hypothetical protein
MTKKILLLVALALFPAIGCDTMGSAHWQWPTAEWNAPKWDWWNSAPAKTPPAARTATKPAGNIVVAKDAKPLAGSELEAYRRKLWPHVQKLQDLNKAYPNRVERDTFLLRLKANLPGMYAYLQAKPPNPSVLRYDVWSTYVIWDFMSQNDYFSARARWKTIAEMQQLQVPRIVTRRDMANFVLDYVNDRIKPISAKTN